MTRVQQIQRWRRYRRAVGGPRIGRWLMIFLAAVVGVNLIALVTVAFAAVSSAATVYSYFAQGLPDPSAIQTEQVEYETVKIYDRTGQHLLYESIDPRPFRGDRTYLPIDQIPELVRDATIALEDRSFYSNIGVDLRGLGRALISNLRGQGVQGSSTITMQMVKMVLIDPQERYERSYARKIKEAIMAIEITRKYPGKAGKDRILEWYLNYNFYGNAAYGIEAAARVYYDKTVADLTLDEMAVLAAIPQYPGLNPIQEPADAYRRQRKVLTAMLDAGYLTQDQVDNTTRYFNTRLLNELVKAGHLSENDLPLVAMGDRPATARALNALVKADYISQSEADAAKKLPGSLWQYVREFAEQRFEVPPDAPHFALYVLQQLQQQYNTPEQPYFIWENGLKVYTTLDWDLQIWAECAARSHIASMRQQPPKPCQAGMANFPPVPQVSLPGYSFDHEVTNASVVAIRPNTGEVLAMVGSLDYFDKAIDGQVNVSLASRQPGSSFKPYTYLTAFETGNFAPASMVLDVRTVFPDPGNPPYTPENYDRKYHGPLTLRQALQRSYNIPAVWLMQQVGISNVIKTARRLGLSSLNRELNSYGLSLTLGGGEVALVDHTYAFGVFANGGVMAGKPIPSERQRPGYRKLDPVYILQVQDKDGKTLDQYTQPSTEQVVKPAANYMIVNVLTDPTPRAAAFGSTAQYLVLPDRPVGAKTGTTNSWVDGWTIGFTPQLAVGVWTGNSDNKPMKLSDGSITAAPIFNSVLKKGMEGLPVQKWDEPPGLVRANVCFPSGLLPTPDCKGGTTDLFLAGKAPKQQDNWYQGFEINRENGKRASVCTPPELIERRIYEMYPLNAADYVRANGIPQPPTEIDGPCGGQEVAGDVAIGEPLIGARLKGKAVIKGNARGGNFRAYKVEVAAEAKPDAWIPIGGEHGNQVSNGDLEVWDTTGFEGLYTLRLVVLGNDGGVQTNEIRVVIDNTPPKVEIVHPKDGDRYVMEDDELVSITADAQDAWEMDRVEFYLDNTKVGESTVAPYSIRWTIAMSDVMPALGPRITEMRPITNPDGTIGLQEVVVQETKVEKYKRADGTTGERTVWLTDSGRGAIIETGVISETHTIKVKAFDRAGNEVESRPVQIIIGHKPKPKKTSWLEGGAQWSGVGNQGTGVRSQPTVARVIAVALKPAINRPDRVALAGWTANGATQPNPQAPAAPAPSADLLIC
jgi:membrane peptidoglycan carboxypeptidase